jgi:glycosyltransferase involved in cell wall biosynthesis
VAWELVVVNNNCTDDTDAVVCKHQAVLPVISVQEPRLGISNARNCALRHARGRFVLWTDDDVLVDPQWMAALLDAFSRFDADLVYGRVEPWWETGQPPSWYSPEFAGTFALLDAGSSPRVVTDPTASGYNVNLAFHRRVVDAIGTYREDIGGDGKQACEDIDLCRRAHARGLRLVYQPDALVRHFIPAARCEKGFNRDRAIAGAAATVAMLRLEAADNPALPRFAGIPRYYFRVNLGYIWKYVTGLIRLQPSKAFFYELKLLRFAAIIRELWRGRRKGVCKTT